MGGTRGVVAHQGAVGGGRQAGGEDNQGAGKPGREGEEGAEAEGVEAAGGVLGPEGVSRPCHRRRSPCPLQKSMEKPVGVQRRVTESFRLFPRLFLKSVLLSNSLLPPAGPNPASRIPGTSAG